MGQVIIAGASQGCLETWLLIKQHGQFTGNGHHHIFFIKFARAYGTRVITTMTSIDSNHYVAHLPSNQLSLLGTGRCLLVGGIQVDNQTVTELHTRRQDKTSRFNLVPQVEHHPQVFRITHGRTHLNDGCTLQTHRSQILLQGGTIYVDHQPSRIRQGKHLVFHRLRQVENNTSALR